VIISVTEKFPADGAKAATWWWPAATTTPPSGDPDILFRDLSG
jgi:hypothetical protein